MSFFNVTISGLESIQEDVNAEIQTIWTKVPKALNNVGREMIVNLQKHIENEWYYGYSPKGYKRRTDDSSLGTPLGSADYMDYSANGGQFEFTYVPKGDHENSLWHTRDGDDLTESIQTGELKGDPPPRPFWNSFLFEQEQSGIINAFAEGMLPDYKVVSDGNDVVGVESESALASGIADYHNYGDDDDTEFLPD